MVRPEGEELEAVGPSREGPREPRRDTDGVAGSDRRDLVAELDLPGAAQNHVDLLRVRMPVRERRSLACPQPEMGDPRLLGAERRPGHACLPAIAKPVRWCRVLNVVQVDMCVQSSDRLDSSSDG